MIWYKLSLKRLGSSTVFLLSLLLMFLAVYLGSLSDRAYTGLSAGYFFSGTGAQAEELIAGLEKYSFYRYDSQKELSKAVQLGKIDCGVVLPEDLEARIEAVDFEESFVMLVSAQTTAASIFGEAVSAELLCVSAPYLNFPILDRLAPEADLKEEILENYRKMWEEGEGFVFRVESVQGKELKEEPFSLSFVTVLISLFLFIIPLMQGCRAFQKNYKGIEKRIGKISARYTVFFPEMLVTLFAELLVLLLAVPLSVRLTGNGEMWKLLPAGACAAVLLWLFDAGVILLSKSSDAIQISMIPALFLTLVLCPMMFDYVAHITVIRYLRYGLPTYWLVALRERTSLSLVLLAVCVVAVAAILLYGKKRLACPAAR